jgi:hypothetical protein
MQRKLSLWFALLSAITGMAAEQDFLLGVNYSELIPTGSFTATTSSRTAASPDFSLHSNNGASRPQSNCALRAASQCGRQVGAAATNPSSAGEFASLIDE